MEEDFRLAPPLMDDLVDTLFRYAEGSGDAGSGFSRFVSCPDFFITFRLCRHQIVLWFVGKWRIVQHLHDVKSSQPDVEASCGFEPPMGH